MIEREGGYINKRQPQKQSDQHFPCAPVRPAAEVVFDSSPLAMQAVLDGVGVAVAQLPYVSDSLVAGRLVAPFPIVPRKYESWYLAYRPIRQDDRALLLFRDWLHQEAKLQRQAYERWM